MAETMRAAVFRGKEDIHIEEVAKPTCGPTDAIVRVTTTTICGTDSHIWREEYPVANGRIVGHEPVGVIDQVGEAVRGYEIGDRVVVGAITPCGACYFCQHGDFSQCAGYDDEWGLIGGWRLGNSADGVQADYFRVPYAQANLAKIPDALSDEEVMFVTDIASTGIAAAETANVRIGDSVVVYAQGPIGLSATAGARLMGASLVIGVDSNPVRLEMAKKMGADVVIDFTQEDPVAKVKELTDGRGADVAIEALGLQETFENSSSRCVLPAWCRHSAYTATRSPCRSRASSTASATSTSAARCARAARSACGRSCRWWRPAVSTSGSWSRTGSTSIRSRRPIRCSPTRRTGC